MDREREMPPAGETLRVVSERVEGVLVVRLAGELDLAGAPRVLSAVQDAPEGARPVVIDLSEVTFIDSTGVRTLLDAADVTNGGMALLSPSEAVVRVLELTQLRDRFTEVSDLEPATLAALRAPAG